MSDNAQKGITLFETIAALSIGAILAIGGFGLYSAASAKIKDVMINNLPRERHYDDVIFGPYTMEQIFPEDNHNAHIFLGDKCMDDFSCRRSFCGQIEVISEREVYVRLKNLTHCIKNMADY